MVTKYDFEFFESGPFASASININTISSNFYYSYLLDKSIIEHRQSKEKFEKALLTGDFELMQETRDHLNYLEGVLKLALSFNSHEELES